jgi:ribosomal subunit interface protein
LTHCRPFLGNKALAEWVFLWYVIFNMQVAIKGINVDVTTALAEYTQNKIGGLVKFYPETLRMDVELERTTQHHQKGENLFRSSAKAFVPGHSFYAEASAADLYGAIDILRDELKKEMSRFKTKKMKRDRKSF